MMVKQTARPATVTATIANTATNRQPPPSVYCQFQTKLLYFISERKCSRLWNEATEVFI